MLTDSIALFSQNNITEKIHDFLAEPEKLSVAIEQAKAISSLARDFVAQATEILDGHEPIPVPGKPGYGYAVVKSKGTIKVDPANAWPVLKERLDSKDILKCISISFSEIKKRVAEKAPRGLKKEAIEEITTALKDAEALSEGPERKTIRAIKLGGEINEE